MRRSRRIKQRLWWIAVVLSVLLLALVGLVLRAVEVSGSAARGTPATN